MFCVQDGTAARGRDCVGAGKWLWHSNSLTLVVLGEAITMLGSAGQEMTSVVVVVTVVTVMMLATMRSLAMMRSLSG